MAFIKYEFPLNVSNKLINDQHKVLFDSLNLVFKYIVQNKSSSDIKIQFENFISLFLTHSLNEEKFITKSGILTDEKHVKAHDEFLSQMTIYLNSIEKQENISYTVILNYIQGWFLEHIPKYDKNL